MLTNLQGVEFAEAWGDREHLALDDVTVPFIGLDALRRNKRATGRHQDLADLEELE